ncbi:envelope glycoprotein G [Macacine alphaherpesvirus 1]|nr:envelope glycoprotein G [Macacine alphaherpesvirus 1]
MRRLVPRLSLLAAVVCLCLGPAGAGPRPPAAPPDAAPAARDPAYCYAVPRLDDVGPAGPAPPVADVDRHPVVRHRNLSRSYSRRGLALLVPPIRRFRGTGGGAYAARVAYYRVDAGGCRRPIALRWYGGCRGGAAPSPSTCGRYSHTYHDGSPPMAHALVNASLLVPVVGSRAAAYDYEILVGDRLHVGRLTAAVAPGDPLSPPDRASRPDDRGRGGPAACRPVAPAVPLWRSIPAAWVVAANPLFDGPEGRRCVSPQDPAVPQDMAYVSAAPQSLLVGLAGYLFALGGRDREGEPPATEAPAPTAERFARARLARSLLSVTTEGTEASPASVPTVAPSAEASASVAVSAATEGASATSGSATAASAAVESATPTANGTAATPAPTTTPANGTAGAESDAGEDSKTTPATPTAAPSVSPAPAAPAANDSGAAGAGPVPSDATTPPGPTAAEENESSPPLPREGGGDSATGGASAAAGTEAPPADPFTPRLEALTPRPGAGGGAERGAGEEDGDDDDGEEGAGDGELPPAENPPPATGHAGPGARPDSHPYPPTPRRPSSRLPPPHLGPLTLRPPRPPTEPQAPSPSPTEPPHTPLFPFLTASPGLDFLFLLSLAAHALAFVVITVMVLRPCRPRARSPSQHRVRYTRLPTSHA